MNSPMPEKDLTLWALALAWLHEHTPVLYAACLTLATAVLRVIYRGGTWCQALLEAPICMLLTLSIIPVLRFFDLSQDLATAAGVWIGYFGVRKVAGWVERVADVRLPKKEV